MIGCPRALDETEAFLTGAWESGAWEEPEQDRVLATILFTDIVGSTERAAVLGGVAYCVMSGRGTIRSFSLHLAPSRSVIAVAPGKRKLPGVWARELACLCAEADRVLYAPSMAQPTRRYHLPSAMRVSPARIDPPAARALLARDAILVDVRRQDDASAAVAGAVRIPPDEIPARLGELSRGVPIVLVCT